ncbi:MAG: rhodanese-like domain-containing protein, partial [Candidatus Nanopelagicaceae bacterium]
ERKVTEALFELGINMKKKLIAIFVSLFALTSCSNEGSASITNVDASTFISTISDPTIKVIDVRSLGEYSSGHLQGALNIDVESGGFDAGIANLDKTATYAVYCRSGRRSTLAAERMAEAGFTNIINFNRGGFAELAAAGAATE